jgi:ribonuclease J
MERPLLSKSEFLGRKIVIEAVGGLGEMGHHHMVVDLADDSFLLDCGVLFPEARDPGLDSISPSMRPAVDRHRRGVLRGLLLTHAHRDHIGAIPELLTELPDLPIFGTRFTLAMVESQLERDSWKGAKPDLRLVEQGEPVSIGDVQVTWFAVTHSLPSASSVALESQVGTLVHSGDFRVQSEPLLGPPCDAAGLRALAERGVDLALVDSTGAGSPGATLPERDLVDNLEELAEGHEGRLVLTTFSSHVERLVGFLEVARRTGRKMAVYGRSLLGMMELAHQQGLIPRGHPQLSDAATVMAGPPDKAMLVVTGSQGEPRAPLNRMSRGEDKVKLAPGDLVAWSARLIPGNEKAAGRLVNGFLAQGVDVIPPWGGGPVIHTSGHARRDEIAEWLSWVRPRRVLPVHGEEWHLSHHRELLDELGLSAEQILTCHSGDRLSLDVDTHEVEIGEGIPGTPMARTGSLLWSMGEIALRERRKLAHSGSATVVILWDEGRERPRSRVGVVTQGVFAESRREEMELAVSKEVSSVLFDGPDRPKDQWIEAGRLALRRAIRTCTGTKVSCASRLLPIRAMVESEML